MKNRSTELTTGDLARLAQIPQQTLIGWDRTGVLKATVGPRRRAGAARRYDEDGLIAAFFAGRAARMGFKADDLREMIQLMQAGKRDLLKRAAIFTYRTYPGILTHVFSRDITGEDDQRYVAWLREQERLVDGPTSLWETREAIRPTARKIVTRGPEIFPPGYFEEER